MRQLHAQQFSAPTPLQIRQSYANKAPAPFPGDWPTRLVWKVQTLKGWRTYLGKSSPQAMREYVRLADQPRSSYWVAEFDRNNYPLVCVVDGTLNISQLFQFYHPWVGTDRNFSHLTMRTYPRLLSGHMIYSPFRVIGQGHKDEWLAYAKALGHLSKEATL